MVVEGVIAVVKKEAAAVEMVGVVVTRKCIRSRKKVIVVGVVGVVGVVVVVVVVAVILIQA